MAKFTIEMSELKKHINFVRNGLGSSKTDLPVMLLRFEVKDSKVVAFAASKEMFCRTEMRMVKGALIEMGVFTILGVKIERLIAQVEAEQVIFSADQENLEVKAGFLTVNFELFDGAVLQTMDQSLVEHLTESGLTIPRSFFEEGLVCGKFCTTINSIRPDVNHVEMRKGRILSSDGRKVLIYQHSGFPEQVGFKVPASCITNVIGAVKNIDAENIQMMEGKSYYFVKGSSTPGLVNEYTLGVRKVERSFPAVEEQILKVEGASDEISIDKHILANMLSGVSLGLPSEEVKVQMEVVGVGSEAVLEVSATNSSGRKSHERANCGRKQAERVAFPISYKHMLDTVGVFKGDSVVDMLVMDKRNLLLVRDKTEAREVLTIIPFRTEKQIQEEQKEREALDQAKKPVKIEVSAEVNLDSAAELD